MLTLTLVLGAPAFDLGRAPLTDEAGFDLGRGRLLDAGPDSKVWGHVSNEASEDYATFVYAQLVREFAVLFVTQFH